MTRVLFIPNPDTLLWLEQAEEPGQLVDSIQRGEWTPPDPYRRWAGKLIALWQGSLVIASAVPFNNAPSSPKHALSRREREVLRYLVEGATTRQIAHKLEIHPRTVYQHVAKLKRMLQAATRAELAAKAHEILK